jgi:hypothetical protein
MPERPISAAGHPQPSTIDTGARIEEQVLKEGNPVKKWDPRKSGLPTF